MLIRNSAEEAGGMAQWVKVFTTKLIANSRVLQAEKSSHSASYLLTSACANAHLRQ